MKSKYIKEDKDANLLLLFNIYTMKKYTEKYVVILVLYAYKS